MTHIGHFSVWGDFEPSEVTTALGLEPSDLLLKGTWLEGAEHPARTTTWDLYCPDGGLNEQLGFLLELLSPKEEIVHVLSVRYAAEMNLVSRRGDALKLTPEILGQLGRLGITLNCFYTEDESDDADSI